MGKSRDYFKKIRDTKGTFHAKVGTIKDRNGMDLTEAEDKKSQKDKQKTSTKKFLHHLDNHDDVIIHQSWTFWNVKSSGPQEELL